MIAFLGPEATNTHAAALKEFGPEQKYLAAATITQVFAAVASGAAKHGVVPIENSTEGVVRETIDCLMETHLLIERELELEIRHELLAPPGVLLEQATRVVSHPQALAQCRIWLDKNLPNVDREVAVSTSAAAREAAQRRDTLALASILAAERYGLVSLASGISDRPHNATRFVGVASRDAEPTGRDRTSLVFTTPHERGALRRLLGILDDAGVNMTRIESRPLGAKRWEYAFVVDVEGHRQDPQLRLALDRLTDAGALIKVLGSYPRAL